MYGRTWKLIIVEEFMHSVYDSIDEFVLNILTWNNAWITTINIKTQFGRCRWRYPFLQNPLLWMYHVSRWVTKNCVWKNSHFFKFKHFCVFCKFNNADIPVNLKKMVQKSDSFKLQYRRKERTSYSIVKHLSQSETHLNYNVSYSDRKY